MRPIKTPVAISNSLHGDRAITRVVWSHSGYESFEKLYPAQQVIIKINVAEGIFHPLATKLTSALLIISK
jgi:hypothetical protein